MAMNFGPQDDDEIIGTINTTPLVDVMLVLLIIFLITIPVVTTSVKVDLPKETNVVRETLPEGFQRAEFLLEKGAIDMIVDRREMRETLARLISKLLH